MTLRLLILLATLTACSTLPPVDWPAGDPGKPPSLLPTDQIGASTSTSDTRGTELAAQAAALRARAAAIGTP